MEDTLPPLSADWSRCRAVATSFFSHWSYPALVWLMAVSTSMSPDVTSVHFASSDESMRPILEANYSEKPSPLVAALIVLRFVPPMLLGLDLIIQRVLCLLGAVDFDTRCPCCPRTPSDPRLSPEAYLQPCPPRPCLLSLLSPFINSFTSPAATSISTSSIGSSWPRSPSASASSPSPWRGPSTTPYTRPWRQRCPRRRWIWRPTWSPSLSGSSSSPSPSSPRRSTECAAGPSRPRPRALGGCMHRGCSDWASARAPWPLSASSSSSSRCAPVLGVIL